MDGDDVDVDSAAVVSDVVVAVRFGSTTSFDESLNGIERMPLASLDQCGTWHATGRECDLNSRNEFVSRLYHP